MRSWEEPEVAEAERAAVVCAIVDLTTRRIVLARENYGYVLDEATFANILEGSLTPEAPIKTHHRIRPKSAGNSL